MAGVLRERGNSLLHSLIRLGRVLSVITGLSGSTHSHLHRYTKLCVCVCVCVCVWVGGWAGCVCVCEGGWLGVCVCVRGGNSRERCTTEMKVKQVQD